MMTITTFDAHDRVRCLRCNHSLVEADVETPKHNFGTGAHTKRCSKCHLVTSYDIGMSPVQAGAIEYEEPDWKERFEFHCARWLKLPRYLAEDSGFEATLKDWRRFHALSGKPAPAYDGMVALAVMGIMPPRNLIKDVERTGACFQEQHDDHMWLTLSQRAWRIIGIEDKIMILESFGEQTQIDLSRAKWEKYIEKAGEALEAMRKNGAPVKTD